jgi:hypothetical protein
MPTVNAGYIVEDVAAAVAFRPIWASASSTLLALTAIPLRVDAAASASRTGEARRDVPEGVADIRSVPHQAIRSVPSGPEQLGPGCRGSSRRITHRD